MKTFEANGSKCIQILGGIEIFKKNSHHENMANRKWGQLFEKGNGFVRRLREEAEEEIDSPL